MSEKDFLSLRGPPQPEDQLADVESTRGAESAADATNEAAPSKPQSTTAYKTHITRNDFTASAQF